MRVPFAVSLAALVIAPAALVAQAGLDTVQIRSQQLGSNVYALSGSGGNIGLAVGDDATFVIDDQFAPLSPKILAAIAAITNKPVRFVINTHWHFDHTGGNENFANAGAIVIAHDNVRKRMSLGQFIEAVQRKEEPSTHGALPVITFADAMTFHINGDSVLALHVMPAHTDGDVVIRFVKANVIHTGDTFVSAGLPLVDLSSGGTLQGIIDAADRTIAMSDANTKIIPGHGPVTDRARLKAWRDMLATLQNGVKKAVASGKTIDQLLADKITAPYATDFPGGHERFLRIAYQELSRKK